MEVVCKTDKGRSRETNEDSCIHYKCEDSWNLIVVADGMGGHNAGEVASSIAVNSIKDYICNSMNCNIDSDMAVNILKDAINHANSSIYEESLINSNYSGMGTTVTAAIISNNVTLIGHVGDSRAYIFEKMKLNKITNDHSLVAELVRNGTITEEEAKCHPQKNIITRALGAEGNVEVDIEKVHTEPSDIVLLCTDGLTNMLSDKEIEEILLNSEDINLAASKLVDTANDLGGYDNITVVVAETAISDGEVRQ